MKITKLSNFEGYWFTCKACGKQIKHAYSDGDNIFGSECIKGNTAKLDKLAKTFAKMLNDRERYSLDFYRDSYGFATDVELYDYFMKKGGL